MALNDEVRIDESTSKRSQITGHLLIVMPKLNFTNATSSNAERPSAKIEPKDKLKSTVNIRNIFIDESEIPPLI